MNEEGWNFLLFLLRLHYDGVVVLQKLALMHNDVLDSQGAIIDQSRGEVFTPMQWNVAGEMLIISERLMDVPTVLPCFYLVAA